MKWTKEEIKSLEEIVCDELTWDEIALIINCRHQTGYYDRSANACMKKFHALCDEQDQYNYEY